MEGGAGNSKSSGFAGLFGAGGGVAGPSYSHADLAGVPLTGMNPLSPYLNVDPRYLIQDTDEFILPTGASKTRGRFELAFFTIGGCCITGAAFGALNGLRLGLKETQNMAWSKPRNVHWLVVSVRPRRLRQMKVIGAVVLHYWEIKGPSWGLPVPVSVPETVDMAFAVTLGFVASVLSKTDPVSTGFEANVCFSGARILNMVTRQGALWANTLGSLALLYSAFGVIVEKTRGAEDDLNTVAAGTMTGMLYKSTGGLRGIARGGVAGLVLTGLYALYNNWEHMRGSMQQQSL